jgi:hypothetical protein
VDVDLAVTRIAEGEPGRQAGLDAGRVLEAEMGERVLGGAAVLAGDHEIEVVVRSRLLAEQRIDAPPPVDPQLDSAGAKSIEDLEHVVTAHHPTPHGEPERSIVSPSAPS